MTQAIDGHLEQSDRISIKKVIGKKILEKDDALEKCQSAVLFQYTVVIVVVVFIVV